MSLTKAREAFLHPSNEFTPIPFWFWNDALTKDELRRQIHEFHDKGVAGFVIHPRMGLPRSIPYLSDCFMDYVRFAVEEAAALDMRVILYDEGMYPSGSAHGMVVKEDPTLASRCLRMEKAEGSVPAAADLVAVCAACIDGENAADVELLQPENGEYRSPAGKTLLCFRVGYSGGTIRGVHEDEDDGEPLAPASADLLNPRAVQSFIRLTHERYWEVLHEHFGKTVIAMFTDEPDIVGRNHAPGVIAWTDDFLADFEAQGCTAADLPTLWLNTGDDTAAIRRKYRRAQTHRMTRTYYGQLADWCEAHGIALTGHPAKGYDYGLLTPFHLPGQDVVWRFVGPENGIHGDESVLAKCASDAARHLGRERNLNECFGCCGPNGVQWAFTMDEMKWYTDWLFVRGTNLLCPHAFFYSLRDGRSNERPPDVGLNNLWWPWYGKMATYMRRLSWLNTGGVNQARVAVLCEEDRLPWQCCVPLYENQIEFNYLSLENLAACEIIGKQLVIRDQRYDVLLIEDIPLEGETAAQVEAFQQAGGVVLTEPELALLPRDVVTDTPAPALRMTHVKKDGLDFYLLVNEGENAINCRMRVSAQGGAEWWNPWNGAMIPAAVDAQDFYTLHLNRRESIILVIDPDAEVLVNPRAVIPCAAEVHPLAGITFRVTPLSGGKPFTLCTDDQGCLPAWEDVSYSGWMAYEAELTLDHPAQLHLGSISGMSRCMVDGRELGMRMWAPHTYALCAGTHQLRIEVCNTLANAYDNKPLPSGMLGPVAISG